MGAGMAGEQGRGKPAWAGQPDEVATLLGMSAEDIQTARQGGKSLVAIADSKGIGEDKLISTILDAKKAIMAKLVADGKLTEAQMALMVEHMQTQVKTMVERTTVGPMQGRQGMGQMRGGMGRAGMGQMQRGMGQGFRGGQRRQPIVLCFDNRQRADHRVRPLSVIRPMFMGNVFASDGILRHNDS